MGYNETKSPSFRRGSEKTMIYDTILFNDFLSYLLLASFIMIFYFYLSLKDQPKKPPKSPPPSKKDKSSSDDDSYGIWNFLTGGMDGNPLTPW